MDPSNPLWASPVEAPLVIEDADTHPWDDATDLVVAGFGGAGVAAALEAVEHGVKVIALDRYEGGGSSAANGGVYYAGGGTKPQRDAGEADTTEEMYKYLAIETDGIVAEATLRRFCEDSVPTVDWLLAHGALLNGTGVFRKKVSYPPLRYHLYHPDNSLVSFYAARAKPAARGHRTAVYNKGKAWGLGPKPYWLMDGTPAGKTRSYGTGHGTPYNYDQHVPIVLLGYGIQPGEYHGEVTPADIAPTLASLCGITLASRDGHVLAQALSKPAVAHAPSRVAPSRAAAATAKP